MAHNSLWKKHQCPQVLCHDYHLPGRNSKNKDIDPERRHLNYNLAPHDMWAYDYLKKKLSEVYCLNRSDVNVLSTWIFTVPRDVKPEDEDRCIRAAYEFMAKRYGEENVVSAWVHKDENKEGRTHIHFNFIPVVWDKKKERFKVSAKEVITQRELTVFHSELEKAIFSELGYHCSVLTGELADRPDLSLPHYKAYKEQAKNIETIARLEAYAETFGSPVFMKQEDQARFIEAYNEALERMAAPTTDREKTYEEEFEIS